MRIATLRERLESRQITFGARDGRFYTIRPIRSSDAPSLMRGYDAMADDSKWHRMLHHVPHLTEEMALQFCTPDPTRDLCVVVEGSGKLDGEILGGARIAGSPDDTSVEFAVSLRPEARSLGLARKSLEIVLSVAKEIGYKRAWGSIHSSNQPMLSLAQRLGFRLRKDPDDLSLVLAELSL